LLIALAGLISGINGLIKWVVGRHRPITAIHPFDLDPFAGGIRGLWTEKNLCFPSGHACLAFAAAAALAMCLPRWRLLIFLIAAMTGVERIIENAHYVSDVVAAALLGVASARVAALVVLGSSVRAA
jgi:membrane-associated phospholipid phosphatase